MTFHWHVATGIAGYGPEGENTGTYLTLAETCASARDDCQSLADMAHEGAYALADAGQYEEAWTMLRESDAFSSATANLDFDRRKDAPLFHGPEGPAKLAESMNHALDVADGLTASPSTCLYVWTCVETECLADVPPCGNPGPDCTEHNGACD